jgi:acetolactate synthase small subunit
MTRHFSLLVDDRPETLLRVTGLCLRRRADVVALRYGRSHHGGWARLDLELAVDERHGRGLAERLGALVEVRDVAELRAYTA